MSCQRLSSRLIYLIPPFCFAILSVTAGLPGAAHAGTRHATKPTVWAHGWRPGWLPGDPEPADDLSSPLPIWASRPSRARGLFIAIDPVTRRPIAPTAEQKRAFADQLRAQDALLAPTAPLRVERLPEGGEIIHLNGAFQVYSIARRDAQGRIITDCVSDPAAARKLLARPVAAPAPPPPIQWEEK